MRPRLRESEQPVPPPIIWRNAIDSTREASARALTYRLDPLPNQKSWTEIPFGTPDRKARNDLPWDPSHPVEIPKTGVIIQGHIDRLDLSGDNRRARVIDYKTGRLHNNMAEVVVKGGSELQRCLYAFAVRTLLGRKIDVEASLLYASRRMTELGRHHIWSPHVPESLVSRGDILGVVWTPFGAGWQQALDKRTGRGRI